jgi:hypothetical protein
MISQYLNFMLQPVSTEVTVTALEMIPDMNLHTLYVTIGFIVVMASVPLLCKSLFPAWYCSLNDKKKQDLPTYLSSMLHHGTVVPLSWYYIYLDYQFLQTGSVINYAPFMQFAAPVCTGFIVADTLFYAIPMVLRGNFEYIIHHVLALWMIFSILTGSGQLMRYLPHIIICDTTNAIFNSAWLLRLTGLKDSLIVTALEMSFATMFFLLRNINLSLTFYVMFTSVEGQSYGYGRFVFPFLSLMQFYWLFCIVRSLIKKAGEAKNKMKKST